MRLERADIVSRLIVPVALVIGLGGCTFSSPGLGVVEAQPNAYECACSCAAGTDPHDITSAPARSSDDSEETLGTGEIILNGQNVDMTEVNGTNQVAGVRFQNIGIPRNATIVSARVQFTTGTPTSGACTLALEAQAADDAPLFTATNGDLSGRARTAASVSWSPPAWNIGGEAGAGQLTPELAAVVQEVVNRPGWRGGPCRGVVRQQPGARGAARDQVSRSGRPGADSGVHARGAEPEPRRRSADP